MVSNNTEYEKRSYEDLSLEFQRLYPSVIRAFELIPLMYNRLTLVDKLSHKQAFDKICDDHKHLSGFSERNIRRYLPSDNPVTPRRVRPSCPKNSLTETNEVAKLSVTQHEGRPHVKTDDDGGACWTSNYRREEETRSATNHRLQEEPVEKGASRNQIMKPVKNSQLRSQTVNEKSLEEQGECLDCRLLSIVIDELKEALSRAKADQISTQEMQFTIPNDKYPQLKAAMDNSTNSVYVTFDKSGVLERAEPDTVG
jgi:hypothetical protein